MDQAQWKRLVQSLKAVIAQLPRPRRRRKYSDLLIVKLYFFAVASDRPISWAADRDNLNRRWLRPRSLPSVSQLNRRVAEDRFQLILQKLHELQTVQVRNGSVFIDGKALCLSPVTQDRDARIGRIPGGFGKGYKLHAVVSDDGKIPVFSVMPLNRHEMPVASVMLEHCPGLIDAGTIVLADGNYDAAEFHKQIDAAGGWLVTAPRGFAKHEVTLRQMGPARRKLLACWQQARPLMKRLYQLRKHIERTFGQLTSIPGLLSPLPAFVRSLGRVRRWVGAKICLYHVHRELKAAAQAVP